MTKYQRTLTVDDGGCLALAEALRLMTERCEAQIKTGDMLHTMRIGSIGAMFDRLRMASIRMTSTHF